MPTGQASDYANYIKDKQAEQQGVANWNSIFTRMLDTQYKIGSTELERASQKNIDSAYSNYLHNQMSLKYTDGLTEGYRHYAEDSIQNEYNAAIATEQQNLNANKATLYSDLVTNTAKLQQQQQENIDEQGLRLADLQNKYFKYVNEALVKNKENEDVTIASEFADYFKYDEDGNILGFSDMGEALLYDDDNGYKTLNSIGQQFYGATLGVGFDEWVRTNSTAEEYDTYVNEDRAMFNEAMTGNAINDTYNPQVIENTKASIAEPERQYKLHNNLGNNFEIVKTIPKENLEKVNKEYTLQPGTLAKNMGVANKQIDENNNVYYYNEGTIEKALYDNYRDQFEEYTVNGADKIRPKEGSEAYNILSSLYSFTAEWRKEKNRGLRKKGDIVRIGPFEMIYAGGDGYDWDFKYVGKTQSGE